MSEPAMAQACTHACSYACGRMYDCMFTSVIDSSTLFLCMPCFASFAQNVVQAMVDATSPEVQEVVANADLTDVMLVHPDHDQYVPATLLRQAAEDEFSFDGSVDE